MTQSKCIKYIKVDIPRLARGPNKFRGQPWMIAKNEKDRWLKEMAFRMWPAAHKNPKSFCYVTIHRYSGVMMDDDNAAASCKPILDTLKQLGFIIDDSPKYIYLDARWRQGKRGNGFTRIILDYKERK